MINRSTSPCSRMRVVTRPSWKATFSGGPTMLAMVAFHHIPTWGAYRAIFHSGHHPVPGPYCPGPGPSPEARRSRYRALPYEDYVLLQPMRSARRHTLALWRAPALLEKSPSEWDRRLLGLSPGRSLPSSLIPGWMPAFLPNAGVSSASASVVAVDRDIFLGQVAGEHPVAAAA